MLATRGNAPVLPVFVGKVPNLFERLRGGRLHVYIGDPITLYNTKKERSVRREAADEVLREIYALGEHFREVAR